MAPNKEPGGKEKDQYQKKSGVRLFLKFFPAFHRKK
jgi:hypothetical protein